MKFIISKYEILAVSLVLLLLCPFFLSASEAEKGATEKTEVKQEEAAEVSPDFVILNDGRRIDGVIVRVASNGDILLREKGNTPRYIPASMIDRFQRSSSSTTASRRHAEIDSLKQELADSPDSLLVKELEEIREKAPPPAPKDYFPLQVGNHWAYDFNGKITQSITVSDMAEAAGQLFYIIEVEDRDEPLLYYERKGYVFEYSTKRKKGEKSIMVTRRNMVPGQSWKDPMTGFEFKALRYEKLNLAAGSFNTVVLSAPAQPAAGLPPRLLWYAPDLGLVQQEIQRNGRTPIRVRLVAAQIGDLLFPKPSPEKEKEKVKDN
jgi:hypothetical protein